MKSNALLTLLLAFCFLSFAQAQSVDELAEAAADGLCDCVNETYSNMDSDVKRAMVKLIKYQMEGKEKEMEDYANSLSEDLATRIEAQAETFQDNDELFQLCVEDIELSLAELALESDVDDISEEEFLVMMIEEMRNRKDCKFAYMLMQVGMMEEDNGANNGQIKGNDNRNSKPRVTTNGSDGGEEIHGSGGN